jgi:hypothetical protein
MNNFIVRLRKGRWILASMVVLELEDEESVVFGKSLRRRAAGLMK